jgi:S-(hydroxymethyl)glutathione dehydrogenase/alcohol dehydrogenase
MVLAVLAHAPESPLELVDIVLPPIGPGDIRVKIAAAGVCHSDLSMVNGTLAPQFPLVLGHEASGEVVETGSAVSRVALGDHVVLNWAPPCRICWFCLHDEPWLCERNTGVTSVDRGARLADGTAVHGVLGLGAFAEEVVVPEDFAVALPPSVPLDVAALLGCSVLTGLGAATHGGHVHAGDSAVVIGLGGVGLSAVAGARLAGADPIVAVDVSVAKEALARRQGATDFLLADQGLAKALRALTGGRGADHVFDCVGSSVTIRQAWSATRRGGRTTIVGVGRRADEVTFNPLELFHFARVLTSSIYGSSDPERDLPRLIGYVQTSKLDLGALVTDRAGLDGVQAAFDRMSSGQGGRTLLITG